MSSTFWTNNLAYITAVCNAYVGENVAAMAQMLILPVTLGLGIYVLLWGFAAMTGSIDELLMDMVKRVATLTAIFGIGLSVGNYNMVITETFLNGPEQFIAAMARAPTTGGVVGALDLIWDQGFSIGSRYWAKGGLLSGDFGMYFIGTLVFGMTIAVTAYAFFLIGLSKVAMTVLVGIGMLFILTIMFRAMQNFFTAWIQQMSTYFLVPILVVAVNLLVMKLFSRAAEGAFALTSSADVDQVFPFLAMGILSLFVLASVLTIAAGLAGGVSLSSFGMGRMASSMIFYKGKKLAAGAGRVGLKGAGMAARPAWKAYQNRNKNSIRKS